MLRGKKGFETQLKQSKRASTVSTLQLTLICYELTHFHNTKYGGKYHICNLLALNLSNHVDQMNICGQETKPWWVSPPHDQIHHRTFLRCCSYGGRIHRQYWANLDKSAVVAFRTHLFSLLENTRKLFYYKTVFRVCNTGLVQVTKTFSHDVDD